MNIFELCGDTADKRDFTLKKASRVPDHIASHQALKKAFTTEWNEDCGLSLMEWMTGALCAWTWCICGARPGCDIDSVKKSEDHTISVDQGWACTEFVGGRNKLHGNKRGSRPWAQYYICLCPGGVHDPAPDGFYATIQNDGNSRFQPNFCTICPLNWLVVKQARMAPEPLRLFAKWTTKRKRFGENHGKVIKIANRWFRAQGADEGGMDYQSNSGRRALAGWLQKTHAPYHEGFEVHADL